MKSHVHTSRFVLRTPLLPLEHRQSLEQLVADPMFREAIAIASPELAASIDAWRAAQETEHGKSIGRALARYALRMAGRATPFGLCAGVSTGTIGGETEIALAPRAEYERRSRPDWNHLRAPGPDARYRVNTSLYELGDRLRYVEARVLGGDRAHHLVELERSQELDAVLERARQGATREELRDRITAKAPSSQEAPSQEDAEAFVDELIDAQVVVAEPDPDPEAKPLVDLYKPARASLSLRTVGEIARAGELLAIVGRPPEDNPFPAFRAAFEQRYGRRAMPLVEVLDEETGIGFGSAPSTTPLLAELGLSPATSEPARVAWGRREARLLQLATSGRREIELSDDDVDALAREPAARLHDTFVVTCALAGEEVIAGALAGPALRTIARFTDGTAELGELCRELARADEANRDAIYAEVRHLPAGREANVVAHPALHAYEIPYLGATSVDRDHQIAITDLDIALDGERVVLRSRRLGREIVPRLSNAHDFQRGLAVYRFLAALSLQDGTSVQWSWGPLEDAAFLPRVRRGKVVLSPARWRVAAGELAEWRARGLPRWVALVDHERRLPIDLDNALHLDVLADLARRSGTVVLAELVPAPDQLLATGPEGRFVSELAIPFVRREPAAARAAFPPAIEAPRSFEPGSEWLYAKLYCGEATSDRVLREVVAPVVAGEARWFFIRYADPAPHLRVRIRGGTLAALHAQLARAGHPCWRVTLDTYERELERYRDIELAEQVFTADSIAALACADLEGDARWLAALRALDRFLADLGLDLAAKAEHTTRARDALAAEHHTTTEYLRRLGAKFRAHEDAIAAALAEPDPALDARSTALRALAIPRELAADLAHTCVNRRMPVAPRTHELVLYDLLRRRYLRQLNS